MLEKYKHIRFTAESKDRLGHVRAIMCEYAKMGYDLSVRQLFYRLVARNLIGNTFENYKNFVGLVTDGRMAGLLDWSLIVDRHRRASRPQHWDSAKAFFADVKNDFQLDRWKNQTSYVEVMVEKDALAGVIQPVCSELDVTFTANKGYSSATAMRRAGKRFRSQVELGKQCVLIYLGDHDPSVIDMTRDVADRIRLFGGDPIADVDDPKSRPYPLSEDELIVHRAALNWDQVQEYKPPENPCKETDSRSPSYVAKFGKCSWELDALDAPVLDQLVRDSITKYICQVAWDETLAEEKLQLARLEKAIDREFKPKRRKTKRNDNNPKVP